MFLDFLFIIFSKGGRVNIKYYLGALGNVGPFLFYISKMFWRGVLNVISMGWDIWARGGFIFDDMMIYFDLI